MYLDIYNEYSGYLFAIGMRDKKKENFEADCAIINLWYGNVHGAILTAYALQTVLAELGYSSKLVNTISELYENETEISYRKRRLNGISESFETRYLKSTEEFYNSASIGRLNKRFKYFLAGSDQVFRAEWVDDKFFLDFVNINKPKIAVAASFGGNELNTYKVRGKKISYLLNRFNNISVREKSGIDICQATAGVKAEWIGDPVFMISAEKYREFKVKLSYRRPYCCCYFRDFTDDIRVEIERFSKLRKINVVYITENSSIEEFLTLIDDAEYVITDSFHGLCFSIIFNTPVYCYRNEARGGARFDSIIEMLGLSSETFLPECGASMEFIEPIHDFSNVNDRISVIAENGRKWLCRVLKRPRTVNYLKLIRKFFSYKLYENLYLVKSYFKRET